MASDSPTASATASATGTGTREARISAGAGEPRNAGGSQQRNAGGSQRNAGGSRQRPGKAGTAPAAAWAALLVVWVVWGSTFVGIRVGVESIPPLAMAGIRYLIAGAVLFPIARRGRGRELRAADRPGLAQWLGMAVVGTMLLAFGNGAASYAEQTLPAGLTALLIATVPIWMVLADRVINGQRIPPVSWLALIIGAAGVAILARPHGHGAVLPVLIVLGGSLSWGTGSVLAGRLPAPATPLLAPRWKCWPGARCSPAWRPRPAS
jgi:drug/metabolite transporter (DMT)-like permease